MSIRLLQFLAALLLAALAVGSVHGHDVQDPSAPTALQELAPEVITGVVDVLVIDDRVNNALVRFYALRLDGGQTLVLTGVGANALTNGARVDVTGSHSGDTVEVISFTVLPTAQTAEKAGVPALSRRQVQGMLVEFHKDYFAQGHGEYGLGVHALQNGAAQMTPLNLSVVPEMLRPGMTVIASGTAAADGASLDTTQITILAMPPAQTQALGVTTTNQVLVMPIKFADSPAGDPFTPAQVDQVMRTNANSVAAYYNEVSYGQQQLNITVACATTTPAGCGANTAPGGWLRSSSATPAGCDFTTIANLADQAATAAGYNIASYNNRFYVLPSISCGWAGLAYIGYPYQAWSDGWNALWVYGHELGHNFSLYHAGGVNCQPQVLGGSCGVSEYGDRFDIMANNSTPGEQMHFDAAQKALLGWIPASSVITHTSGTGTYVLSPLESGGQSTYAVTIPVLADTNRTYWIEYRQPIGFDSGIAAYPNQGAIIHVSSPFDYPCTGCGGDDTEVLDMAPGTSCLGTACFYNAALLVGQTYTDSAYGISVKVNSATASALSVTVSAGGSATTTTLASSANPSLVGANVTFTATVTGSAPTGSIGFTADGATLTGCGVLALPSGSASSKSASCSTSGLAVGTHSIVASYSGDSANAGSSNSLSQVVSKAASITSLATSGTPSIVGASVTFTAMVSGTAPAGTVNFLDSATSIAGCAAVVLSGSGNIRTVQCPTTGLTVGTHSITATYSGDAMNAGSASVALSQVVNNNNINQTTVWVDDAVPAGATLASDGGDAWNWISGNPAPYSGALAHQSALASGVHQHYFYGATATLSVAVGDTLFTYVYLDPANPPSEVMLQWNNGSWEHRAYWGADLIGWGTDGTASRVYMGALPAAGQWVKLAVPAAQLGLEGNTLNGMAYTLYNGRATWDYTGKTAATPQTYQVSGSVTLSGAALSGVNFAATGGVSCTASNATGNYACTVPQGWSGTVTPLLSGYTFTPTSLSYSSVAANQTAQNYTATLVTYQVSGTVTLSGAALSGVTFAATGAVTCTASNAAGGYACTVPQGWSGTVTPSLGGYTFAPASLSYTSVAANQTAQNYIAAVSASTTVWVDDAVPAGATLASDGGDAWNWISSNPAPYSGSLAHQSALASGAHQHYFYGATATLSVAVGDTLFTYVYLDPANPPSEVMLQWNNGSWEHRAYWGADLIAWGTDGTASRLYMGALPAAGQWVKLAVPAAQLGLEGNTLNGMAYTLYNGRATWDYTGKKAAPAPVWVDDAVPAGATLASDGGDAWNWISSNPAPYSGALAHQSALASGLHQHYFYGATATLPVAVGDTLFTYVYLDPANPPSEVMLQWNNGSWEHRAYWGADLIGWGTDGTASRVYMGALPAAGQWVELAVPAAQLGLEGSILNGMAYTLYNGRATWDYSGK